MKYTGEGSSSSSRNQPNFFKVLFKDFEERLQIPKAFVKHFIQVSESEQAILKGPSGKCWHVKVNRTTDGMYLEDGWEAFVSDHSLKKLDFLVFTYYGNMQFRVKIFNATACQREDTFTVQPSKKTTDEGISGSPSRGFNKGSCDTTNKDSKCPSHLSQHSKQLKNNYCKSEAQGDLPSSSNLERPKITPKRDVQEAAYSFTSRFPYFVTSMKHSNVNNPFHLTIPVQFAREHLPSDFIYIFLKNEDENTWAVQRYVHPVHSNFLVAWKEFVTDNYLKQGDYCVFELMEEDNPVMNVHIFRS